jgi:hypothetical protein
MGKQNHRAEAMITTFNPSYQQTSDERQANVNEQVLKWCFLATNPPAKMTTNNPGLVIVNPQRPQRSRHAFRREGAAPTRCDHAASPEPPGRFRETVRRQTANMPLAIARDRGKKPRPAPKRNSRCAPQCCRSPSPDVTPSSRERVIAVAKQPNTYAPAAQTVACPPFVACNCSIHAIVQNVVTASLTAHGPTVFWRRCKV